MIVSLTSSIVFGPSFPSSFFIASKTNCSLFCRNFFSSSHNSTLYRISVGAVLRTRTLFSFHVLRCYSVARRVLSFFFLTSSTAWDSIPSAYKNSKHGQLSLNVKRADGSRTKCNVKSEFILKSLRFQSYITATFISTSTSDP